MQLRRLKGIKMRSTGGYCLETDVELDINEMWLIVTCNTPEWQMPYGARLAQYKSQSYYDADTAR